MFYKEEIKYIFLNIIKCYFLIQNKKLFRNIFNFKFSNEFNGNKIQIQSAFFVNVSFLGGFYPACLTCLPNSEH